MEVTRMPGFSLGTFSVAGCLPFAGLVIGGDRVIAVEALRSLCSENHIELPNASSTLDLLNHWHASLPALQFAAAALERKTSATANALIEQSVPMSMLRVHAPVTPRQIFMSGANYFKHVVDLIVDLGPGATPNTEGMNSEELRKYAEDMMTRRRSEGTPYVLNKPVSALSGPFDPIVIPAFAKKPDWELELAVVIGAPARHVKRSEAMNYVAGYTIANDITNRDWVWVTGEMKSLGTDWLTSKSCPTYLPLGPTIVPASLVPDPQNLDMLLKLNGETKQAENTSDMLFDVARLIEHISKFTQLLPGDVICTGSPSGNGTHYNRFLRPGDVIESAISGLGSQRTPVVSEPHV